jgi:hypothetical protein
MLDAEEANDIHTSFDTQLSAKDPLPNDHQAINIILLLRAVRNFT